MTSPDNDASWAALEEMLTNAEDFYQSLGLPYQVSDPSNNRATAQHVDGPNAWPAMPCLTPVITHSTLHMDALPICNTSACKRSLLLR